MTRLKFDLDRMGKYDDPREMPAYAISEAAHYLNIPETTIRAWVRGTSYTTSGEKRKFCHVIDLPEQDTLLLSFYNLVEAHVLRALRINHKIRLEDIRKALQYVEKEFGWSRPLVEKRFLTDGAALFVFVEHLGALVDASAQGQIVIKELVQAHLERLDWEEDFVARLYPFTRSQETDSPKLVFIDPRYSFGRPVLKHCGVSTSVIAGRYKAGDSIAHLVEDYGCTQAEIEEAIRCELSVKVAA